MLVVSEEIVLESLAVWFIPEKWKLLFLMVSMKTDSGFLEVKLLLFLIFAVLFCIENYSNHLRHSRDTKQNIFISYFQVQLQAKCLGL